MAIVDQDKGKKALTHYKTKEIFGQTASLVECQLETGRTHQIRVHLTSKNHPLIGDQTYGTTKRKKTKALPQEIQQYLRNFPRQALHAYSLGLIHPKTHTHIHYTSALPTDMEELLAKIRGNGAWPA